ncbi:hypothetical protein SADUNF_Sadunf14G0006300 [Salix dunnii]|uniref:Uncharacterized protein n=1 Tax=Salix dunnii TaxID=1413687 RepID=A0A835MLN7_9ROSI|nr:hypothetical protein SADUNF_Sadunf14G0006300 [Salix dunnii]
MTAEREIVDLKGTKHKTRQAKALENARKAPRYFLELLYEMEALFSAHVHLFHLIQSDVQGYILIPSTLF